MSEYDVNGDGYADNAITVDDGSTTATVVDVDGDGYADMIVYGSPETGYDTTEYGATDYGTTDYGTTDYGTTDPGTSDYYNDALGTGVSSDGDVGYISLGDGTFQDFGMG